MTANEQDDFDPARRLCPDGSCIGVIGPDGLCGICGLAASGDQPIRRIEEAGIESDASPSDETASAFDPNRRLCSDESCIGVVGTDGRCAVCGKPSSE